MKVKLKVIMLDGQSRCGKTTTLNYLYDAMVAQGGKIIRPKTQIDDNLKDFECVLEYEEKKVAIFTMGDIMKEVNHAMSFYEGMDCDILVCACNNRFARRKNRLSRYQGSQIVLKSVANSGAEKEVTNKLDVDKIISHIQTINNLSS